MIQDMKGLRAFFVNACEERMNDYINSEWALSEMHALDVSIERATGPGTHCGIEFATSKAAVQNEAFDLGAYVIAQIMWALNYFKKKRKASYMYITSDFEVTGIEDPNHPGAVLFRCEFYVERDGDRHVHQVHGLQKKRLAYIVNYIIYSGEGLIIR